MLALNKCLPVALWSEIESSYVLSPYTQSKILGDLEEKENWSNFLAISLEQGLEINLPYIYLKALFSS